MRKLWVPFDRRMRGPLQLGAGPGRHEAGAASRRQRGPEIRESGGETFPGGGPHARCEPRARNNGRSGGFTRLRLEVAKHDEAAEAVADEDLRDILAATHRTTQRLQVTQQLAEAR